MASAAFSGGVNYADGSTMSYATAGAYCTAYKKGLLNWEITPEYAPGVSGAATKNYGMRSWSHGLMVTYIGSSEEDVLAQADTDQLSIASAPSTLTVGGKSFSACVLKKFDCEQPKNTGLGTVHMTAVIIVDALRLVSV